MITRDKKDLEINGPNFALAATSIFRASKDILEFNGGKTNFIFLTDNKKDKNSWKKELGELLKTEFAREPPLCYQSLSPENFETWKVHMGNSNLIILPMKPGSTVFTCEALFAIAAGVPILASNHSGMVSLLEMICPDESVVRESFLDFDTEIWTDRFVQKLLRPKYSQRRDDRLREELLKNTTIT